MSAVSVKRTQYVPSPARQEGRGEANIWPLDPAARELAGICSSLGLGATPMVSTGEGHTHTHTLTHTLTHTPQDVYMHTITCILKLEYMQTYTRACDKPVKNK